MTRSREQKPTTRRPTIVPAIVTEWEYAAPDEAPVAMAVAADEAQLAAEADEDETEKGGVAPVLRSMPPWLISAVFHMAALLILAFLWIVRPETKHEVALSFSDTPDAMRDLKSAGEVPFELNLPKDDLALVDKLPPTPDPFAQPMVPQLDVPTPVSAAPTPTLAVALRGRDEGSRQTLLGKYGGTQESEEAVRRALAWLARQQRADGSWSMRGPYTKPATGDELAPAATAMALIAFQGNGNTHKRGQYQKQVDDGINWLIAHQADTGQFVVSEEHDQFYTQGLCTIAVCELYGMSGDSWLREPAMRAVDFCVKTQAYTGGWRYGMSDGRSLQADLSVTGWIVMGLQSARMAGLNVPADTLEKVGRYLDENSEGLNGSYYAYVSGDSFTPSMTAEGLLCRQYLGWQREDDRLQTGVQYLVAAENLPTWDRAKRNVYAWYYATQVTHHMEGKAWTTWNGAMRDLLVKHQESRGKEAGSWDPEGDRWGSSGGRLFVTCLSVYILEVYYRHLPLYADIKLPAGR